MHNLGGLYNLCNEFDYFIYALERASRVFEAQLKNREWIENKFCQGRIDLFLLIADLFITIVYFYRKCFMHMKLCKNHRRK